MLPPSHPNWQPDPTGERLATIRAARRGALLAIGWLGPVVGLAAIIGPPEPLYDPLLSGMIVALMSLPGLAMLGAALTPAVLTSRAMAATAGVAMGVAVPLFSVLSTMVAVFVVVSIGVDTDTAGRVTGLVLRDGVIAGASVAPLIAIATILWVATTRRIARQRLLVVDI